MPAVRILFTGLMLLGILVTILIAASRTGLDGDKSDFLFLLLSMGSVALGMVPDLVGAVVPEKYIDETEADRRAAGGMAYIYRLMGEIGFIALLVVGIILYRNGLRF